MPTNTKAAKAAASTVRKQPGFVASKVTTTTAGANGVAPRVLDDKHKRLLDKQAALLKIIRERGLTSIPPPQSVGNETRTTPVSKAAAREIAMQVGILTSSGKLAASYKK